MRGYKAFRRFYEIFQKLATQSGFTARRSGFFSSGARLAVALVLAVFWPLHATAGSLPDGFVWLSQTDASIRQDIRYAGSANFLGRPAKGYDAPACILTSQAAIALSKVQAALARDGLTLLVFDCYRPQRAVADFVDWTKKGSPADPQWHPGVRRDQLVDKGYIGAQSTHSRGSTVDLAIASLAQAPAAPVTCGAAAPAMLDFGSGFDCFDEISETAHPGLGKAAAGNRARLASLMKSAGFRNYSGEWWHFTLKNEPFRTARFDFLVTDPRP